MGEGRGTFVIAVCALLGCGTSTTPGSEDATDDRGAATSETGAEDTEEPDLGNPLEDEGRPLDDVENPPLDDVIPTDTLSSDEVSTDVASTDGATTPGACAAPCSGGLVCIGSACVPPPSCPLASERGCGFVTVPGGSFTMGEIGSNAATPLQPNITVRAFGLDTHELTVARFRRFWDAGHPPATTVVYPGGEIPFTGTVREPIRTTTQRLCNWSLSAGARESHPLACVDWWTAQAFCVWDGGRLPTAAEFEWAARNRPAGGLEVPRTYAWGNATGSPGCDRAHWNFCKGDDMAPTRRVGSYAGTPDVFDLTGSVREWLADSYIAYTDGRCWGGVARVDPLCSLGPTTLREYRGGSWCSTTLDTLRNAARYARSATSPTDFIGFRCARNR